MATKHTLKDAVHKLTVTPQEHSTVRIEGEIPYTILAEYRAVALKALGKDVSIDGFRKGHVPEQVLLKRIGEMTLLSEMAERALAALYPQIVTEHALDVIGHPKVQITKLAPENPLGFSATVAVVPEVTLPDYQKIARETKKESTEITDQDLADTIANIQRQKVAYERMQQKAAAGADDALPTPETVEPAEDAPLPELTDEYVKTLGAFETVDDFKTKLREHLAIERAQEVTAKHRATITDRIIEESTIDLPAILVDSEIGQMFGQMEHDLKRANLSIDDYLSHLKKTKEDLRAEWAPAAEKRAKLQLVLNEIAKREKITAPEDMVASQVQALLAEHKDADPARVALYVHSTLVNDAVMRMLEAASAE